MSSPIGPGSHVVMHFSLLLEDGTEIVSTFDDEPMAFTLGDGTMEPALETKLIGMNIGDEQALLLMGNDIYGERDGKNQQWIAKQDFPGTIELNEGNVIAFTTPAGDEVAGTLALIEDDRVMVDFNHPLSGRDFIFRTAILQIAGPE